MRKVNWKVTQYPRIVGETKIGLENPVRFWGTVIRYSYEHLLFNWDSCAFLSQVMQIGPRNYPACTVTDKVDFCILEFRQNLARYEEVQSGCMLPNISPPVIWKL